MGDHPSTRLPGKVAVVTGAARGIGRASAIAMAQEGAAIVGIDVVGPVGRTLQMFRAPNDQHLAQRVARRAAASPSHSTFRSLLRGA